jgi:sugar transferase (PEP-CTERM/EpsH1 system associated)
MANVLFLVHRIPYPPNKGDKLRSFHLLQAMAAHHKVFLGTLADDPDDLQYVPALQKLCADVCVEPIAPRRARVASLLGLATGEPLTLRYFSNASLQRWVDRTVAQQSIDAMVVFSSSVAPYAMSHPELPLWVDFVDVDSAKWAEYAQRHHGPLAWLYGREARRLLAFERQVALRAECSYFTTEKETALFRRLAPECADRVEPMNNGVDTAHYAPDLARPTPYAPGEIPLVFTGAMDYWPNVDAVQWFAAEVLPRLRQRWPALRFHIVGRSPTAAVRALAARPEDAVAVSGTVPDVRPWLQHAAVVVAPLRLARGVQNKVLEAMAMARPVVAASACAEVLDASPGADLLAATSADDYVLHIDNLLRDPARATAMGAAGRDRVLHHYTWAAHLAVLDRALAAVRTLPARAAVGAASPQRLVHRP